MSEHEDNETAGKLVALKALTDAVDRGEPEHVVEEEDAVGAERARKQRLGQLLGSWSTRTRRLVEHELEVPNVPHRLYARLFEDRDLHGEIDYSYTVIAEGIGELRNKRQAGNSMDYETALARCTLVVQLCEQLQEVLYRPMPEGNEDDGG